MQLRFSAATSENLNVVPTNPKQSPPNHPPVPLATEMETATRFLATALGADKTSSAAADALAFTAPFTFLLLLFCSSGNSGLVSWSRCPFSSHIGFDRVDLGQGGNHNSQGLRIKQRMMDPKQRTVYWFLFLKANETRNHARTQRISIISCTALPFHIFLSQFTSHNASKLNRDARITRRNHRFVAKASTQNFAQKTKPSMQHHSERNERH